MFSTIRKGNIVAFGRREVKQTDGTHRMLPIEWIVLEVYEDEREALLLSRWLTGIEENGLTEEKEDEWNGSYLRWMLNDPTTSFSCYRQWFTDEERARITSHEWDRDHLFLPAWSDIRCAFSTPEARAARIQPGEAISWSHGRCSAEDPFPYWLCEPSDDGDDYFRVVDENGEPDDNGYRRDAFCGVRPAVYVRLDAWEV